jgi:hypothetical protein
MNTKEMSNLKTVTVVFTEDTPVKGGTVVAADLSILLKYKLCQHFSASPCT